MAVKGGQLAGQAFSSAALALLGERLRDVRSAYAPPRASEEEAHAHPGPNAHAGPDTPNPPTPQPTTHRPEGGVVGEGGVLVRGREREDVDVVGGLHEVHVGSRTPGQQQSIKPL